MSETKLVSPLLDGFTLGAPISNHYGICCCPAMKENSDRKYIVKIIAVPASQVQLDALLVTGAYKDPAAALDYFREQADGIADEAAVLQRLSKLEGFLSYEGWQVSPMRKNRLGYYVYLVSDYRRSLEKFLRRHPITHLEAVNLGLDLCSALAMCRQAGYLYTDLKPSNVYIGNDGVFRISDLGFVPLSSLRYSSLPEKYCSEYSAPEVRDAMNTLNETVDTYSVGMILYRIFNDGNLPAYSEDPEKPLPAPCYADEQMSAIILKACAPKPEDRYADPAEMGQALAAYLQLGTVNDVPICPEPDSTAALAASQETIRFVPATNEEVAQAVEASEIEKTILAPQSFREAIAAEVAASEAAASEPEAPEEPAEPEEPEEPVTEPEPIPEPAAEPVAVGVPDDEFDLETELNEVNSLLKSAPTPAPRKQTAPVNQPTPVVMGKKRRSFKGFFTTLLVLIVLAAAGFCGYCFYQFVYLQTVNGISISGTQDKMTVTLDTEADDSVLTVTCIDIFGNALHQKVSNKQATFTDLKPDSLYKVSVEASGLHRVVGQVADVFTTESQTEIVSIAAVTGPENGSVLLTLTVHGHEPDHWKVTCTSEGEPTITESFTGHSVTVKGLTVGKNYTITVDTDENMELMGNKTTEYLASDLISANNLSVISRIGGELTVVWDAPANFEVETWVVRCYGEDYDETQAVTGNLAIFSGTEDSKAYNIEVTATGMTQPTRTTVSANPVTITNMTFDDSTSQVLNISWTYSGEKPKEGWLLLYTMDGSEVSNVIKCGDASAVISPIVPGAAYQFSLQTVDNTSVFNGVHNYQCPAGSGYTGHAISSYKIECRLLPTPSRSGWLADQVDASEYTDTFTLGQKISMVLEAGVSFYLEHEDINVLFVIRDASGKVVPNLVEQVRFDWHDMWVEGDYHLCELNVPNAPALPGSYTVDVYFNGALAASKPFTVK